MKTRIKRVTDFNEPLQTIRLKEIYKSRPVWYMLILIKEINKRKNFKKAEISNI